MKRCRRNFLIVKKNSQLFFRTPKKGLKLEIGDFFSKWGSSFFFNQAAVELLMASTSAYPRLIDQKKKISIFLDGGRSYKTIFLRYGKILRRF